MNLQSRLSLLALTFLISVASCLLCLPQTMAQTQPFKLTEGESNRWLKGNMHTHSLWSDGDDYPEMIARWYDEHRYQFLVFH